MLQGSSRWACAALFVAMALLLSEPGEVEKERIEKSGVFSRGMSLHPLL